MWSHRHHPHHSSEAHVVGCTSFASFTDGAQVSKGAVAAYLPAGDLTFGVGALVFSCTGRIAPLGAHREFEAAAVTGSLGGAKVAGFFTYGEFARVTGSTGFHNATVVVLAV